MLTILSPGKKLTGEETDRYTVSLDYDSRGMVPYL